MKIYIDENYKCYISNPDGKFSEHNDPFFNGKCQTFIEGYRFVPAGETWTRSDGIIFHGEMITPWKPYSELDAVQREYEKQKLLDYETKQEELNTSYQEGINSI